MYYYYNNETMKRLWIVIFTIKIISQPIAGGSPKICPNYCTCSWKDDLNHADCSGARLISPHLSVPYEVQSLDLSYNDLTVLDNDCFKGYIHLMNITISNNAIQTIFLESFVPLKRIRAIDLSCNRLESIDPRIFESNRKLQALNLAGNKFTTLSIAPLMKSRYLRTLNLAHSQINVLLPQHYSDLVQLQELDLSHNLIITIDKFAENAPKRLSTLNLEGNNLNCDRSLQSALELLESRNVDVSYGDCQEADSVLKNVSGMEKKFERMELVDEQAHEEAVHRAASDDKDVGDSQEEFNETVRSGVLTGWHFPNTSAEDEDYYTDFDVDQSEGGEDILTPTQAKSVNETCRLWCLKLLPPHTFNNPVNFGGRQYTDFDLLFVFLCGIAVGVAFTIFISSCIICIWRCSTVLKATHIRIEDPYDSHYAVIPQARRTIDTVRAPIARSTEPVRDHIPIVLPQLPRRRQRRTPSTQRALVRHDQCAGGDNFISRLFGRPARHQYYRTINENTAHLIRHLSRSNLFNNRMSQHFADRERNTPPNTPEIRDVAALSNIENELEGVVTATRTPHRRRPETPPPLYSEIVAKRDNQNS